MKKIIWLFALWLSLLWIWYAQDYIYFYWQGCSHCAKVDKYFTDNWITEKFNIEKREVYTNSSNREALLKYCDELTVPMEEQAVPMLIINDGPQCSYLVWDEKIINHFKAKLQEMSPQSSSSSVSWITTNIPKSSKEKKHWREFFLILLPAAVADSINPCEFAIMLVLLSSILTRNKSYKKAIFSWLLFSLAIFLSYFLMWLGLYKVLSNSVNIYYLKLSVWILWILVWLANLKDYFWWGKWFVMEVPFSRRPAMARITSSIVSPRWAFWVWIIVSLFLLPCTSWPYFTILWYLSSESHNLNTWWYFYLLVYNLVFILPMLFITLIVWMWFKTVDQLNRMKEDNKLIIHLIVWLLMIWLWLYVLNDLYSFINF